MDTDNLIPDSELQPSAQALLKTLDHITETAPYAADPRVAMAEFARSFALYLRTPDPVAA